MFEQCWLGIVFYFLLLRAGMFTLQFASLCVCHVIRGRSLAEASGLLFAGPGQSAADPVRHPRGLGGLYLQGAGQHWKPSASCPPVVRLRVCHIIIFT